MTQEQNPGSEERARERIQEAKERAREHLSIKWMPQEDGQAILNDFESTSHLRASAADALTRKEDDDQLIWVSTSDGKRIGFTLDQALEAHRKLSEVLEEQEKAKDKAAQGHYSAEVEAIMSKPTMSVDDLATILGVGRRQAYDAVNQGTIPSIRLGKRILISTRIVEGFLAGGNPESAGK